jgi:hypothetical protein
MMMNGHPPLHQFIGRGVGGGDQGGELRLMASPPCAPHEVEAPPSTFHQQQANYFSPSPPQNQHQHQQHQNTNATMAEAIHQQVCSTLSQSRLMSTSSGIRLVHKQDIRVVERVLGQGAFSKVTAVQMHDGSRYACKHLQQELLYESPDKFQTAACELALEAHLLGCFDHPHILRIRGWAYNGVASFQEDGAQHDSFFLLLDMLEETLEQRIDRWNLQDAQQMQQEAVMYAQQQHQQSLWKRFLHPHQHQHHHSSQQPQLNNRLSEKLEIMQGVASALSYLHERGVLFRDLKPANIGFLNGKVQLFDFGLSRELPLLDTSTPFCMSGRVGTLRYMAPEVALNQPYNTAVDIFSWSMVAWEILFQQKPLDGWTQDMYTELVCRRGARPELNHQNTTSSLQKQLYYLLQQAWAQLPDQRPRAGQLYEEVSALLLHQQDQEEQQHFLFQQQQQQQLELALQQQQQQQQALLYFEMHPAMFQQQLQEKQSKRRSHHHHHHDDLDDSIGTIETTSLSNDSFEF